MQWTRTDKTVSGSSKQKLFLALTKHDGCCLRGCIRCLPSCICCLRVAFVVCMVAFVVCGDCIRCMCCRIRCMCGCIRCMRDCICCRQSFTGLLRCIYCPVLLYRRCLSDLV